VGEKADGRRVKHPFATSVVAAPNAFGAVRRDQKSSAAETAAATTEIGSYSMRAKTEDLHGSAPDKSDTALLIIDVINDLDFPEANQLMRFVPAMARKIARLKERAKKARVPVIYVNDNFGRWRSDFRRLVEHCRKGKAGEIVDILQPDDDDYFVLKPKHSGFFSSTLETLLHYLGARTLVLTGIAGNYCVLFTANDAYMRDYKLVVTRDCTVSNTKKENDQALALMKNYLKADTRSSTKIRLTRAKL
jgi:nicotinamidase-related amidase